ncbi:MarR family transcriptional regulator [Lachnospiraceae bacterium 64-25]|nr:transcriptional regulator SlyA [Lachnospiraceae bacterium]
MDEKKLMEQYDKMNRKMQRHFSSYFSDSQLTSIQGIVLHYIIVEKDRGDIFPKDLEEFLGIKGSSVTSLINNLEQGGYLRRESLESDGRYKKLVLTEKTKGMQEDILKRVYDYIHSMFVGIPEEHLKIFESVILQMTKNADG